MEDQEKLQQLMQAYQAAKQQGVPDSLNPNQGPSPVPSVMQGVGDPNNIPVSKPSTVSNLEAQTINGIPQYLSRQGGQTDQYKNNPLNRLLMAGLPESLGGIKSDEDKKKEADQVNDLQKMSQEEPSSNESQPSSDTSTEQPAEQEPTLLNKQNNLSSPIESELKTIPKRNGQYDLNHLQAQMQASRIAAGRIAGGMGLLSGVGAITDKHFDLAGQKEAYANELGKAADYQRLIQEQRMGDEQDIKNEAAQISYNKALVELGNEKLMNNPDSDISTAARSVMLDMAKQSGMNINTDQMKNLSYSNMAQLMPNIDKVLVAKLKADQLKEVAAQRNQYMQQHQQEMLSKFYDQQGPQFAKAANAAAASVRSGMGVHFRNLAMGDRVFENIGTEHPTDKDLNSLNPQQVNSIITDYASMLLGGQPTKASIEELSAKTGQEDLAKLVQYISGNPQGAEKANLLKPVLQSINRLRDGSKQRITQAIDTSTSGFAGYKRARPEDAKDTLDKALKQLAPLEIQQPPPQMQSGQQPAPQQQGQSSVRMIDPQGKIRLVPADQVDNAIRAGGKKAE